MDWEVFASWLLFTSGIAGLFFVMPSVVLFTPGSDRMQLYATLVFIASAVMLSASMGLECTR